MIKIFLEYNILIKLIKSYLNYPDIGLLGQQVNFLGLTTFVEKLKAIQLLAYPNTLGALEYYFGLTNYFCNYIHFYTQLAAPFQVLKTFLLYGTLMSGQQCWAYTSKTKLGVLTLQKLAFFQNIQDALATFLHLSTTTLTRHCRLTWMSSWSLHLDCLYFIPLLVTCFPRDANLVITLWSQSSSSLGSWRPLRGIIGKWNIKLQALYRLSRRSGIWSNLPKPIWLSKQITQPSWISSSNFLLHWQHLLWG